MKCMNTTQSHLCSMTGTLETIKVYNQQAPQSSNYNHPSILEIHRQNVQKCIKYFVYAHFHLVTVWPGGTNKAGFLVLVHGTGGG